MKSKLLAILMSLAMVFTMMPVMGQTAYADEVVSYDLYVSGKQVTSDNMDDVLGDGTVKFTPAEGYDSSRLTLKNAKIEVAQINETDAGGIYMGSGRDGEGEYVGSLVIDLDGENLIKTPDHDIDSDRINGIVAYGKPGGSSNLTIAGDEWNGDNLKMEISADGDRHTCGVSCTDLTWLYVRSDLSMDVLTTGDGKNSYGIHTYGNLHVDDKTDMDISGYNATGILCDGYMQLDSSLAIDLNMKKEDVYSTGIQGSKDSKLDINGGSVKIRSGKGVCNYGIANESVNLNKGSLIVDMGEAENESYGLNNLENNPEYGLNVSQDYLENGGYVEITGHSGVMDPSTTIDPDLYNKGVLVNENPTKEGAHTWDTNTPMYSYKYLRIPEKVFELTMHWSSIDREDIAGQEPVVIEDIPAGMTIEDALAREGMSLYKGVFKKDGYFQYGGMYVPLTDYNSWEELLLELLDDEKGKAVNEEDQVTGDTEFYIMMLKEIKSVSATVEPPVCGEETITQKNEDGWDLMSQTNPPKYSFPSGADYDENNLDQFPKSYWCDAKDTDKPFTGKFEGGEKYDFVITVTTKYGYGIWQNTSFQVNGKEIKDIAVGEGFLIVLASDVEAVHDWDAGEEIKPATTTEDGKKLCTCKGCGKEEILPIPRLTPKANPLSVKGRTATLKGSTKGKKGKLKKTRTLAVSKVITFRKKGQGKMTYTKASGNKKIKINKSTGKVTVKKGLKKGTYKVKVKVKAAGNASYSPSAWKTVTFRIKIK